MYGFYYRAREMDALAQRPNLDTVKEESEEEANGKDKQGQTELHKLAAQEGTREREREPRQREKEREKRVQNSLWIRKMIRNVQILISSTGADLTALLNLGYNLAERDISCKTPRDVAVESGVQDNINAIGNYSSPLLHISEQI